MEHKDGTGFLKTAMDMAVEGRKKAEKALNEAEKNMSADEKAIFRRKIKSNDTLDVLAKLAKKEFNIDLGDFNFRR